MWYGCRPFIDEAGSPRVLLEPWEYSQINQPDTSTRFMVTYVSGGRELGVHGSSVMNNVTSISLARGRTRLRSLAFNLQAMANPLILDTAKAVLEMHLRNVIQCAWLTTYWHRASRHSRSS